MSLCDVMFVDMRCACAWMCDVYAEMWLLRLQLTRLEFVGFGLWVLVCGEQDLMVYTILYIIILFLLVQNFLLAIVVEVRCAQRL
eukprot:1317073-Rhodomonas_salina.1